MHLLGVEERWGTHLNNPKVGADSGWCELVDRPQQAAILKLVTQYSRDCPLLILHSTELYVIGASMMSLMSLVMYVHL